MVARRPVVALTILCVIKHATGRCFHRRCSRLVSITEATMGTRGMAASSDADGRGRLKDPAVCRVFYSSPFNGMEGEREELTRRYWPQLQSACGAVGVRFVPVDMRWGITMDQSTSSQTINICLSEIDRSDVFVGFFGQVISNCGRSCCFGDLPAMSGKNGSRTA